MFDQHANHLRSSQWDSVLAVLCGRWFFPSPTLAPTPFILFIDDLFASTSYALTVLGVMPFFITLFPTPLLAKPLPTLVMIVLFLVHQSPKNRCSGLYQPCLFLLFQDFCPFCYIQTSITPLSCILTPLLFIRLTHCHR